ncbi:MAG: Tfp pilus assembly protein FimT/FimU [Bacillota bacterium]
MASRSTLRPVKGFTLPEMLVVIALLAMMAALGAFVGFDAYRASLSRSEHDIIVSLLERARSSAMSNIDQTSWGVCYIAPNYVLFRGTTCTGTASTDQLTEAAADVSITGLSSTTPVVFSALSGTTTSATITVSEQARTSTITVNYEGAIE